MMLKWEHIVLQFVSAAELEDATPPGEAAELALGLAARLWEEDRTSWGASSRSRIRFEGDDDDDDNNQNELGEEDEKKDEEMDQLEMRVVDNLADEEEEERIRRGDGIPSMSSLPPSKSSLSGTESSYGGDDDGVDDGKDHSHDPYRPPRPTPEARLESCADSAFGLTSLPTAPWLLRFRHTLDASTDGLAHEMTNNPAVVVLVATTNEDGLPYLDCLAELANVHHLPRPYHDGRYDPNGLRREF